jgi:Spy/CpxP family protein refolding chaperone
LSGADRQAAGRSFVYKKGRRAMRKLSAGLTLAALVVAVWATMRAADAKAEGKDAPAGLVERLQDLNLTDEQEARIADIRKENKPKVQEAVKELAGVVKDELDKIRAVLTPEQREKVQAMKEDRPERREECVAHVIANLKDLDLTDAEMTKIGEIRKEYRPKIAKALEGLSGTLSDAQRKAREEALSAGKTRKEVLEALKLTDQQKEKVQAVAKEVAGLVREEMEKIGDVLTAEQKEKLQEFKDERPERVRDRRAHAIANFKDLNLTDDQKTKIADIRKEYRPMVQEAGNKLRASIKDEVAKIVAVIKA